ncbi:MAG: hypothetical protein KKA28_20145 [Planctomycetes bacterium]|nr:hypothetical protein [Planctomycetota bacterium]
MPHQVTAGVRCLAFPHIAGGDAIATALATFSPDWQVLVRTEKTARIFDLVQTKTNAFWEWRDTGVNEAQPPLFAVRATGPSRMAVLTASPQFVLLNFGNPGFPQVFMKLGDQGDNPSDGFKLIVNTLRWLGEPVTSGKLGGYQVEKDAEVFQFPKSTGVNPPLPMQPVTNWFKGFAGLHSSLSDGKATVAEYSQAARQAGISFVMFTDPWELLTDMKYEELKKQCEVVSDSSFRAVPGIQYSDVSGIRWVYFNPAYLPPAELLEPGSKRVLKDGLYASKVSSYNASHVCGRLARLPLSVARIVPDPRNLWWYHFLALWEYRRGKLDCDNTQIYFKIIGNQQSLVPTAYADISTIDELKAMTTNCVMKITGKNLSDALANILPVGGFPPWPLYSDWFMYVTQGPQIDQFNLAEWNYGGGRLEFTKGLQYFRCCVMASSEVGLAEVAVLDGNGVIYRRFLPKGEKKFARSWTGVHDRQHAFVVRVTDTQGRMAYSSPRVTFNNARGLYFCSDNQNALQTQNHPFYHPGRHEFPGKPPNWIPSFYGWRGWDGMQNMVRQAYVSAPYIRVIAKGESNLPPAGVYELPPGAVYERPIEVALASYFCNVFKTKTTRGVGPYTTKDVWASAVRMPTGETSLADQEITSIIPASRANLEFFWFRPQYMGKTLPEYKAALSLFEGKLRFKKEVTLSDTRQPIPVVSFSAWKTGLDSFYWSLPDLGVVGEVHPFNHVIWNTLAPGGFVTAGPLLGSPFLANAGKTPMVMDVSPDRKNPGCFGAVTLGVGKAGEKIAAGTELSFRVVTGFLTDGEKAGRVGNDVAISLNLGGGTKGYPIQVSVGKLVDANFLLTLEAQGGETRFTAGPRNMVIDLPVRIKGVVDNGSVAFYEKKIGYFIFVPVVDGDALFQVAIDAGVDVWAGNVIVSEQPGLKFTLIETNDRQARLEVHNPLDKVVHTKLMSPTNTPLIGGWVAELDVPQGDSVYVDIPLKSKYYDEGLNDK